MPAVSLSDKVVLVTGASSGIGAAVAEIFAEQGCHLVIGARRLDRLQTLAENLQTKGAASVLSLPLDVCLQTSVDNFVQQALKKFPQGVGVLVNNAGLAIGVDRVDNGRIEEWQTVLDTNVMGVLRVTRALLPAMLKQQRGHIVMMNSVAAHVVYEGGSVYAASKHALRAITKTMRLELNGTPIRVSSIDPGMVETEFSMVRLKDTAKAGKVYEGMTPLSARDIAETVLFVVQRPAHVNIDEIMLMSTDQAAAHKVHRRN